MTGGLDAVDSHLDTAIGQMEAVGLYDKVSAAGAVKEQVDAARSQVAALRSAVDDIAAQIQALTG